MDERKKIIEQEFREAVGHLVDRTLNVFAGTDGAKVLVDLYKEAEDTRAKRALAKAIVRVGHRFAQGGYAWDFLALFNSGLPESITARLLPCIPIMIVQAGKNGDYSTLLHLPNVKFIYNTKYSPDNLKKAIEPSLIEAFDVSASRPYVWENISTLLDILKREDISEPVREAVYPLLIRSIKKYGADGETEGIVAVSQAPDLPEVVIYFAATTLLGEYLNLAKRFMEEEDLGKRFDILRSTERIGRSIDIFLERPSLSEELIIHIAEKLTESGNRLNHSILGREELSDEGRIKLVKLCGEMGFANELAVLRERGQHYAPEVREAIDDELVRALQNYGKPVLHRGVHDVQFLLDLRTGRSVPQEISDAIGPALLMQVERSEPNVYSAAYIATDLLMRNDLSDSLRGRLEENIRASLIENGLMPRADTISEIYEARSAFSASLREEVERCHLKNNPEGVIAQCLQERKADKGLLLDAPRLTKRPVRGPAAKGQEARMPHQPRRRHKH